MCLANFLEPLHHREHENCGKQAKANENAPDGRKRQISPETACYLHRIIANGCGSKPSAHHSSLEFWRSHLANKRDAHGAKQKFSKREHKVGTYEQVGRCGISKQVGICTQCGGCRHAHTANGEQTVSQSGYQHAVCDLARGCWFFTTTTQG